MKYYKYISMLLFVGLAALTSCTQDENIGNEGNPMQGFQISVTDTGFKTDNATRATEKDYATIFTNGDAIGIFAVRNGEIVSNIDNVKCTMQDGAWEMDTNIEYKESEFKKMSFYAYYPYNAEFNSDTDFEASKTLTDGDPFEKYIANWKIEADQNETNYTKYDLMTSVGKASGQRLKGEITFTMRHRMALAVLQMPEIVYNFTNTDVTIEDYALPTQAGTFKLNNQSAKPYKQEIESETYYRFLVNPNKEFTIAGSYLAGTEEKGYDHTATLASGQAKLYKVKNPEPIKHLLSVGDYLCADGSIVSKDADAPENAVGVVFYVGNPQPSVTHASTYTKEKDILSNDYPECKHGLVLAYKNAVVESVEVNKFGSAKKLYYSWFSADDKWKNRLVGTETKTTIPGFMGYNNAVLMENGALQGEDYKNGALIAMSYINAYRSEFAVPEITTPWYLPSAEELEEVRKVMNGINTSIEKIADGQKLVDYGVGSDASYPLKSINFYWATTERNSDWVWANSMTQSAIAQRNDINNYAGFFRMMLAF